MLLDPNKLETLVIQLNQLHFQGVEYVLWIQDEYAKVAPKGQPAVNNFIEHAEKVLLGWRKIVITLLMNELGNGREAASLLLAKLNAISMTNYPEKLGNLVIGHKDKLEKLEAIIIQLEEKFALSVRKEIAEKEYDADIVYHLDYHPQRRVIMLNNIEWHTLSLDSTNHKFFEYLWARPNQAVPVDEIRQNAGIGDKKISTILSDMGFVDNIKMIFFPQSNDKGSVQILPIVRKQDIYKNNLPVLTREDILALAKKKSPSKT